MANNLREVLEGKNGKKLITEIRNTKELLAADDYVVAVLSALYDTFYSQIHEYLAPIKTKSSELEIRQHLSFINSEVLPLIESKFKSLSAQSRKARGEALRKINGDYKEYEHSLCHERFLSLEKLAIAKLKENAMKCNQRAIEYLLDYIGYKATDKLEVKDTTINVDVEE